MGLERVLPGLTGLSNAEGNPRDIDFQHFEVIGPNSVEVRFGNPEVDAPRLIELFKDAKTIEHLQGIVPFSYIQEIIDSDTGEVIQREVPATTEDDIRNMYRNPNITLLTAETPSGIIVGTCTVEKLSANLAEIGRVVVDPNYRGQRIVDRLLETANSLIFREGSGGLDCRFAQAFVIVGVPSYHIALNAFRRQGYEGKSDRIGATYSWSNELGRLVDRTSQPMELTRKGYIVDFPGDHIKYFPTLRPPKAV